MTEKIIIEMEIFVMKQYPRHSMMKRVIQL